MVWSPARQYLVADTDCRHEQCPDCAPRVHITAICFSLESRWWCSSWSPRNSQLGGVSDSSFFLLGRGEQLWHPQSWLQYWGEFRVATGNREGLSPTQNKQCRIPVVCINYSSASNTAQSSAKSRACPVKSGSHSGKRWRTSQSGKQPKHKCYWWQSRENPNFLSNSLI